MSYGFFHLVVLGCYQFVICARISPLRYSNEDEKAFIRKSLSAGNYSAVAAFLRRQNLRVLEFPENAPVVLMGDIAISFEDLIDQSSQGRTTNFWKAGGIWKDGNSAPHLYYFFDAASKTYPDSVHPAVKSWTDSTCIQITELESANCSKTSPHGAVCVMAANGCWSNVGKASGPNKPAQPMSLAKGCDGPVAAHEFGHALGFQHMQARSDRDNFISCHHENLKCDLTKPSKEREQAFKGLMEQATCIKRSEEYDLPVPYDYESIMHYRFDDFTDEDARGFFFTRNIRHQHMLMYTIDDSHMHSHYDLFIMNTVYGCVKDWTKLCEANGKNAPKCQNLGYLGKNCKCICPRAFAGPSCERKIHDLFSPLPNAHVQVDVKEPQIVKFKQSQFTNPVEPSSRHFEECIQFITVIIRGNNDTYANVFIEQNPNITRDIIFETFGQWFIDGLPSSDSGSQNVVVLWGTSKKGLMRADYTSSFLNNETDGVWLRARFNELDILSRCQFSCLAKDSNYSVEFFLSLTMHVTFDPRADQHLEVKNSNSYSFAEGAAALAASLGGWIGIGILAGCALVTALIIVICCLVRKKSLDDSDNDSEESKQESSEDESSDTGSNSSDSQTKKWYRF